MSTTLQLSFLTENEKTYTINISGPAEPVNETLVSECMNLIMQDNIFVTENGVLTAIKGAQLVTRTVEVIL